jgi:hypothetical protein
MKYAGPLSREDRVVLPPDDERRRLLGSQVRLPLRIPRDVRAVVVEEVELDPAALGPCQGGKIDDPVVGTDMLRVAHPLRVDPPGRVRHEEVAQRCLGFRGRSEPVLLAQMVPEPAESLLVGVAVLDDEPVDALRVAGRNPKADRPAVVLDEQPEAL